MEHSLDYKKIGIRIHNLRKKKNLSQAQLAEMIDVSDTYISHIETGSKHASLEVLVKISNALGLSFDSFLLGNNPKNANEYMPEIEELIADCSPYEKAIIFDVAKTLKTSLRDNKNDTTPIDKNSKLYIE